MLVSWRQSGRRIVRVVVIGWLRSKGGKNLIGMKIRFFSGATAPPKLTSVNKFFEGGGGGVWIAAWCSSHEVWKTICCIDPLLKE
jgi:hypothetical protein